MAKFCTCCKYTTSAPTMDFEERGVTLLIAAISAGKPNNLDYVATLADVAWFSPPGFAEKHAKFLSVTDSGTITADVTAGNSGAGVNTSWNLSASLSSAFLEVGEAITYSVNYTRSIDGERIRLPDSETTSATWTRENNSTFQCTSPTYADNIAIIDGSQTYNVGGEPLNTGNVTGAVLFVIGGAPGFSDGGFFGAIKNSLGTYNWTINKDFDPGYDPDPNPRNPDGSTAKVPNAWACGDIGWTYVERNLDTVFWDYTPWMLTEGATTWTGTVASNTSVQKMNSVPHDDATETATRTTTFGDMVTPTAACTEVEGRISGKAYGALDGSSAEPSAPFPEAGFTRLIWKGLEWRYDGGETHPNWIHVGRYLERRVRFQVPAAHIANGGTFFEVEYEITTVTQPLDPNAAATTVASTPEVVSWSGVGDFTDWITAPPVEAAKIVDIGVRPLRYRPHSKSEWFDV